MNVTLYTINDAESDFCKQAKDFLNSHNIPFENKDVEHDRAALSAMLAVSDNFSGVPVMVVGEGADQKVVKGFTPEEYEVALGLAPMQTAPAQAPMAAAMPVDTVAPVEPVAPVAPVEPVVPSVASEPVTPAVPPLTTLETSHDDDLKGIMDTLAQNGMPAQSAAAPENPVEPAPVVEVPVDDHPVNPNMDMVGTEPQTAQPAAPAVTPPAEFAAAEPSTWANQPVSTMPSTPSTPAAPAWNAQPAAPVAPAAPTEPTVPMTDMPSVPDFPQK